MPSIPDTRHSLFMRLRDPNDPIAWTEFCRVYEPVILRLGNALGLQDADSRDLAQEVIAKVWRSIATWTPDETRGKFRTWLHRIVRNQWIDSMRRLKPGHQGSGDSSIHQILDQTPQALDDALERELRRELFLRAAEQVRGEVATATWLAFWRTAVEDQPLERVAQDLGIRLGSVYAARSRVMARIRATVEQILIEESPICEVP